MEGRFKNRKKVRRQAVWRACWVAGVLASGVCPGMGEAQEALEADPRRDLYELGARYFREAREADDVAQQRRNYELAEERFGQFLASYGGAPEAQEVWFFRALAARELGREELVQEAFEKAALAEGEKYAAPAAEALGVAALKAGQWERAARWFGRLAEVAPSPEARSGALARQAVALEKKGDRGAYRGVLERLRKSGVGPYDVQATLTLARLEAEAGRKHQAAALYRELRGDEESSRRGEALLQGALLAHELGEEGEAKELFRRVLAEGTLKGQHGSAQLALMELQRRAGDWAGVLATYQRGSYALEGEAFLQRLLLAARACEELGREEEALRFYQEMSQRSPRSGAGFEAGHRVLLDLYRRQDAQFIPRAQRFLKDFGGKGRDPQRVNDLRLLLATRLLEAKRHEEAVGVFSQLNWALVGEKNALGARYGHALAALKAGSLPQAVAATREFAGHHREDGRLSTLLLLRGDRLAKAGQQEAALEDYRQVLFNNPPREVRILILQRASKIYQEQKNYERFVLNQKALLKTPGLPSRLAAAAHHWIGWDALRRKQFAEALTSLELAREISPDPYERVSGALILRCAYHLRDEERLLAEVTRAGQLSPPLEVELPLRRWLAARLVQRENFAQAWDFFEPAMTEVALEQHPAQRAHWALFLQAAGATGHHAAARRAAEFLLEDEKKPYLRARWLYELSRAWLGLGEVEKGTQCADEALELRPQGELDFDLRLHSGDLALAGGDAPEAARLYVMAARLYASTPEQKRRAYERSMEALEAQGTPEALKQRQEYGEILKKLGEEGENRVAD